MRHSFGELANRTLPDDNPLVRGETSLKPPGHRKVGLQDQTPHADACILHPYRKIDPRPTRYPRMYEDTRR